MYNVFGIKELDKKDMAVVTIVSYKLTDFSAWCEVIRVIVISFFKINKGLTTVGAEVLDK